MDLFVLYVSAYVCTLDCEANLALSASCLMIGMVDSKHNLIFLFYYILTSTSLYVLLQYYATLQESLPYTLYKLYRLPKERGTYLRLRCLTTTGNYVDYESIPK